MAMDAAGKPAPLRVLAVTVDADLRQLDGDDQLELQAPRARSIR
jgi:hypothetical protein